MHADISPSFLKEAMACHGRAVVKMFTRDEEEENNEYAELGTAAHALLETSLRENREPKEYLGQKINDHLVDQDMVWAVAIAFDYVTSLNAPSIRLEERVYPFTKEEAPLSVYEAAHGTADVIIDCYPDYIEVADYKHGMHVWVNPQLNYQLMAYLLGALNKTPFKDYREFRYTVIQPRHPQGGVSTVVVTPEELERFKAKLKSQLGDIKALQIDMLGSSDIITDLHHAKKLTPSEQCRFCPLKLACPALREYMQTVEKKAVSNIEEAKEVYHMADTFKRIGYDAGRFIRNALIAGEEVSGFKLVRSMGNREWTNPDAEVIAAALGVPVTKEVLLSPAQVEKLLQKEGKQAMIDLVKREEREPTLAITDDPREKSGLMDSIADL